MGVFGYGDNNSNSTSGVDGETVTDYMQGVRAVAYGTSTGSSGIFAFNNSTIGGNAYTYGAIVQNVASAASSGTAHVGVLAYASGATYDAGLFVGIGNGESVLTTTNTISSTPTLPRSWNGSMFTQMANTTATGGRIYWESDGYFRYVNSTGSADYSEYFNTADQTLGVGEVVALDPNQANSVRRARPVDATTTVGIVSLVGTRLNDNNKGNRDEDMNSINVGFIGQVPVLITTENGNIKPGDPLTLSTKYRGRAVKATGPCRIIGYATTHFPYVEGEKDYEVDILGGDKQRLNADHVMCYLNVGWYEPANAALNDGIEPTPVETWHATMARLNATIVSPQAAEIEKREAILKEDQNRRMNSDNGKPAPHDASLNNIPSTKHVPTKSEPSRTEKAKAIQAPAEFNSTPNNSQK
jgi:hypothetical protein